MLKVYCRYPYQARDIAGVLRHELPLYTTEEPAPDARAFKTEANRSQIFAIADRIRIPRESIDIDAY